MSQTSKKLPASQRLAALFDDGLFYEIDAAGADCGAKAAYGSVGGATVFAFCQDASVNGGAVDKAQARKLAKVYDLAAKTGAPVVTVYDSKGVKLEDGFAALEAAGGILGKAAELSGVVPQIAVVAGECAGFMAMMAASADLCIMCKDAELFMTPAFLDKTGAEEKVGSAEFAKKAGIAALICEDEQAALAKAAEIVRLLPLNNLAALPVFDFVAPVFDPEKGAIVSVADEGSAVELFEGASCVKTALATVAGTPCGLIELSGEICKCGSAKAAKLIQLCDSFNLPIVTFVDAEGFKKSAHADRAGAIRTAAALAQLMAEATTVKISVVTGNAIGSVFTAFCGKAAGADMTYAWNGAVISPVSAKAAVALLWDDRIQKNEDIEPLAKEYGETVASAEKAAQAGLVDAVIDPASTRDVVVAALDMLASKRVSRLPKKHGNIPL